MQSGREPRSPCSRGTTRETVGWRERPAGDASVNRVPQPGGVQEALSSVL